MIDAEFAEKLLLHHMASSNPNMVLALGTPLNDGMDDIDDQGSDWPYPSRFDKSPFKFRSITEATRPARTREAKRTRLGLPITVNPRGAAATVFACADTGADVNIMSETLAQALGFREYETKYGRKKFRLANGKVVESVGQVWSPCAFGAETDNSVSMACIFHVLTKVVTPIIMGMQFLEETETLTRHPERLIRVPRPALQALSVCLLESPRQFLHCKLNNKSVTATSDTGSEIDLIAPQTAIELGIAIQPGEEVIELADGTFAMTSGYVHANISLDSSAKALLDFESKSANTDVEFHILNGLTHTVLIGQDTLEELKVFTENQQALVSASVAHNNLELNRIRSLGAADKLGSWFKSIFRSQATNSSSEGTFDASNLRRTDYGTLLTVY